jgi:hypothetical protein
MGSPFRPCANGPTIRSLSKVSYTSGPSCTSPRSSPPAASSYQSCPLIDLSHFVASDIEPASSALLDRHQSEMERSAFQSANLRRDKVMTDHDTENHVPNNASPLQRAFPTQQPQSMRTSTSAGFHATRNLASNNWRTQALSEKSYGSFDTAGGAPAVHASQGVVSFPGIIQPVSEQQAALMPYPNIVTISEMQLDSCYAYCFDRGNGQYTQLIPADMLPPLRTVPALQLGCQGMIVLSPPHALPPTGRSSNNEPVLLRVSLPSCHLHRRAWTYLRHMIPML